jgi:alkanesulfonate monooxygenase SsuD/methylene tetrahydromethanopterin reductase-like flavin-dependent oxidoreductase (luciferase family)
MPQIQFGWTMPSIPPDAMPGDSYVANVQRGLGLIVGHFDKEDEYIAYGYDFPSAGTRVEELEEAMRIIKAMWHERQATVQGRHYRVVNAWNKPKPNPIPAIMIGGSKPRMLRLIARHADWWNISWTRHGTM